MGAGTPIALCVLSAGLMSGGCRQLLGLEDPTTGPTPDGAVDSVDARGVDATTERPVNLRTASNFVVLAKVGISGPSATVKGNLGVSPASGTSITGFSLSLDASTQFFTSTQVTGRVYAADNGAPTPAVLQTAVGDMEIAYAEASLRSPDFIDWNNGSIDGMTLASGVYRWNRGLGIQQKVNLSGSATDVWIFQIAGPLNIAANTEIALIGGALPTNVFWQTSGAVTLGSMGHLEGILLAATAVTSGSGSSIKGRVLSQTDVTVTGSTVVEPAP